MKLLLTVITTCCFAGSTISTQGDFLWWTARQDNTSYATSGAVAPVTSKGKIHRPDFGFDPGFRVGLGWHTSHDAWDVRAVYTWFHSHASDSTSGRLLSNWRLFATLDSISKARVRWSLHINVIDLELGREFAASDYLKIRPFIGVKGTWQEQDYRTSFRGPFAYGIHNNHDFWGAGIRAGFTSWWLFVRSFGLYGDFAISGITGKTDTTRKDTFGETILVNTRDDHTTSIPVIELALGLKWGKKFEKYEAALSAGFEQQVWLDMGQFIKQLSPDSAGNLSFMGLTVRGRVDF